jgi:UrcA family protein
MTKIFLATLLAFTATPALAEPPVTVSTTVQTADLDLSSPAGQQVLNHRLALAAKAVCGTASDIDVAGKNDVRHCRADTLAKLAGERDQRIASASNQPIEVAAR